MISLTPLNLEKYKENLYFHDYKIHKIESLDDGFSLYLNGIDSDFIKSINKTKSFNEGFLKEDYIISFFGVVATNELIKTKAKIEKRAFQIIDFNLDSINNKILVTLCLFDLTGQQNNDLDSFSFCCASINIE